MSEKYRPNKEMKAIYRLIKKYDIITLYGHVNPDCDCYGSSIGFRELLRERFPEKKIYALGFGPKYMFKRISYYDEVDDETIKESLAIIIDVSELSRVSDQRVLTAKEIAKIDHHIEGPNAFKGTKWVDVNKIAAAQMIAEFGFAYHFKFTKKSAEPLYLGILTDSGRFRYPPTDASTHRVVAKLYDVGIETKSIFNILYQSDADYVKYQSMLVQNFETTPNNVIYCFADVDDYKKYGFSYEQVSKNVNVLGNIKGCPIWTLFTRSPEGKIRVEFRSSGLNIQKIAVKYGGGGHRTAAGAMIDSWDTARQIVADLDELAGSKA